MFLDAGTYFFDSFLANLLATVFMLLNLNQIMSVIFNVPAAVFSTVCSFFIPLKYWSLTLYMEIVACRAVRRLMNFSYDGPEMLYVFPEVLPFFALRMPCLSLQCCKHISQQGYQYSGCEYAWNPDSQLQDNLKAWSAHPGEPPWKLRLPCLRVVTEGSHGRWKLSPNRRRIKMKVAKSRKVRATPMWKLMWKLRGHSDFIPPPKFSIAVTLKLRVLPDDFRLGSMSSGIRKWFCPPYAHFLPWACTTILWLHYNLELKPSISTFHSFPRCNLRFCQE